MKATASGITIQMTRKEAKGLLEEIKEVVSRNDMSLADYLHESGLENLLELVRRLEQTELSFY